METDMCPSCRKHGVSSNGAMRVCTECGLVAVEQVVVQQTEVFPPRQRNSYVETDFDFTDSNARKFVQSVAQKKYCDLSSRVSAAMTLLEVAGRTDIYNCSLDAIKRLADKLSYTKDPMIAVYWASKRFNSAVPLSAVMVCDITYLFSCRQNHLQTSGHEILQRIRKLDSLCGDSPHDSGTVPAVSALNALTSKIIKHILSSIYQGHEPSPNDESAFYAVFHAGTCRLFCLCEKRSWMLGVPLHRRCGACALMIVRAMYGELVDVLSRSRHSCSPWIGDHHWLVDIVTSFLEKELSSKISGYTRKLTNDMISDLMYLFGDRVELSVPNVEVISKFRYIREKITPNKLVSVLMAVIDMFEMADFPYAPK